MREPLPGDFVRIDDGELVDLRRLVPRRVSRCVFELVYFSRPDSTILGKSVNHRNHHVGRTFINPVQALRVEKAQIKFNPACESRGGRWQ